MSRPTQVVILCEDSLHSYFARHFLIACGFRRERIRVEVAPPGQGAGEHFVRARYPQFVHDYRRYRAEDRSLVIMIDADIRSVEDHFRELDKALVQARQDKRQPGERIGVFIPKRAIETWIYYLQGQAVNEEEKYPHLAKESDCKEVVEALAGKRQQPLPDNAPPSLQTACGELGRIISPS